MNQLYIVATPIGNLEDITLRALRILKEVDLIAAEDTRETRKLLNYYKITTPLLSYYEKNKITKIPYILKVLETKSMALVSEAGMPGINDPGYELINAVIKEQIPVTVIPGPSALTTALSISGLPSSSFLFKGFIPRRRIERRNMLSNIRLETSTLVFFESPHRLTASLSDMVDILGDRKTAITRELTKVFEEVFRGTLSQAQEHFEKPRGEFTIIVAGHTRKKTDINDEVLRLVGRLGDSGLSLRMAIKEASAKFDISSRSLYAGYMKWIGKKDNT